MSAIPAHPSPVSTPPSGSLGTLSQNTLSQNTPSQNIPSQSISSQGISSQSTLSPTWQLVSAGEPPSWFTQTVRQYTESNARGEVAAQLLWQRGIRTLEDLAGFVDPDCYTPHSPFAFGAEMRQAVARLREARDRQEPITIWGDFDADGITATSVLWEGLGQFFPQGTQLSYFIPNRLTESHGLSTHGLQQLADQGCRLIVTCDTGSTNLEEIHLAQGLGMDVIVTDHHTLLESRPPVVAIINPRSLESDHPLAHLSGVAVAYKLVEALYHVLPTVPQQPLESLLDLVAIGLIADLVQLKGDCRYLAQRGIEWMQRNVTTAHRPGLAHLLDLCKRSGDRPTDISFGIGPRINAVSRIQGDASFCVELLTSRDAKLCRDLAEATELANTRRKSLQQQVLQQAKEKLEKQDLSTLPVLVLDEPQWPVGVLGIVAGQLAQEYGRPAILLSSDLPTTDDTATSAAPLLARGSARSVRGIDLYSLMKGLEPLLHRFGGHPFAAGLSLPVDNIPLFAEAISQKLRQLYGGNPLQPTQEADVGVTVADLGQGLFRELKLLEPCGMGNPAPKLLLENCWFDNVWNRNLKDSQGKTVRFIKTEFDIWDDSVSKGFPGLWWGHYKDEIPTGRCDAIAELDYNTYKRRYEIRLLAVRPHEAASPVGSSAPTDWILDWREWTSPQSPPQSIDQSSTEQPSIGQLSTEQLSINQSSIDVMTLTTCPRSWGDLHREYRKALQADQKLAIAFTEPPQAEPLDYWHQLVGMAKYLSRTGTPISLTRLQTQLNLGDRTLHWGLQALQSLGFTVEPSATDPELLHIHQTPSQSPDKSPVQTQDKTAIARTIAPFLQAIQEEHFRQRYFAHVPLTFIQATLPFGLPTWDN